MRSNPAMIQIKQAVTNIDGFRRILTTTTIIVVAGVLIWLLGRSALHYQAYQQIERLTAQALRLEGRPVPYDPWRDLAPLTDPAARTVAQQALATAQRLAAANPHNLTIQHQLGQAALLLDQPEIAIPAFSTAVMQQPDSPLRWFELGLAYERLASPATTIDPERRFWDILPPPAQQWELAAPPVPAGWWQLTEPIARSVLVGERITLRTSLPITPTTLIFWMGNQMAQATTYRVLLGNQVIGEYELPAEAQGWQLATLDLSRWSGQAIELLLASDHGQAGWGDVQIIPADEARCAIIDCRQRARAAWQRGGFTADQFLNAGTVAFRQQQFADALVWYQRATLLGADTASAMWYIRYLATADREALARSVAIDHGWVNEELLLRAWFEWGLLLREERRAEEAEQAFRRAIMAPMTDPASQWRLSEAYRYLGLTLWDQNRLTEALPYLAEAVKLNPSSAWAHIHYGKVLYLVDRARVSEVEQSFATALALDPRPEIWRNLIEFWRWQQEPDQLIALCAQAQRYKVDTMKACS
ncbi:tetratricopeptide repeat protein [Chloroflexus sp.]|uniref:tetratricopeptide repeat protein n=1 Tax=Chloroflexus sp. TaxID=1904827 RepID=UPI002ACF070C|nr:tetratricopeptide repeat protein [Chloroflexus sp.]